MTGGADVTTGADGATAADGEPGAAAPAGRRCGRRAEFSGRVTVAAGFGAGGARREAPEASFYVSPIRGVRRFAEVLVIALDRFLGRAGLLFSLAHAHQKRRIVADGVSRLPRALGPARVPRLEQPKPVGEGFCSSGDGVCPADMECPAGAPGAVTVKTTSAIGNPNINMAADYMSCRRRGRSKKADRCSDGPGAVRPH